MEASVFQEDSFRCPQCNKKFKIQIWLIVDTVRRLDLVERIRNGTLHDFTCPKCHLKATMDVPLLLYRPGKTPTLIFSPANKTSDEEDGAQLMGLVSMLRKRLGRTWQDSWLTENAYIIPRKSLPLSIDSESGQDPETSPEAGQSLHVEVPADVPADLQEDATQAALAMHYYKVRNDVSALDQAIVAWKRLLRNPALAQTARAFRWSIYNDAGNAFFYRSRSNRDLNDLEQGISLWSEALNLTSDPKTLAQTHMYLCVAFTARNSYAPTREFLEESVKHYRAASRYTSASLPQSPEFLSRMGDNLLKLYQLEGHAEDLEDAVDCFQQTVEYTAPDSPDLPDYLKNLANGLIALYGLKENPQDLEQAIQYHRQAQSLLSPDSPDTPLYLSNLGAALGNYYNLTMNLQDLDEAINLFQEAVDRTLPDSLDFPGYLLNSGIALTRRYEHEGQLRDLRQAIENFRRALALTQQDSPDFSNTLYHLGIGLNDLFAHTGQEEDLEEAISVLQQAVNVPTPYQPLLPAYFNALAGALIEHYRRKGQIPYLEEAIAKQREALRHASSSVPAVRRTIQYNLATMLMKHYDHTKQSSDLEQAIELFQEAVQGFPLNSPDLSQLHRSLGDALSRRYVDRREQEDLDEAVMVLNAGELDNLTPVPVLQNLKQSLYDKKFNIAANLLIQALEALMRAEETEERRQQKASIIFLKGYCLKKQGLWLEALKDQKECYQVYKKLGNFTGAARAFLEMGNLLELMKNYDDADLKYLDAYRLYRKEGNKRGMAWACERLGRLASRTENFFRAIENFEEARNLYVSLDESTQARTIEMLLKEVKEREAYFLTREVRSMKTHG